MPNDYQYDEDDIQEDDEPFLNLPVAPDRGRIIIVNFDLGGGGIGQEMRKPGRPCRNCCENTAGQNSKRPARCSIGENWDQ